MLPSMVYDIQVPERPTILCATLPFLLRDTGRFLLLLFFSWLAFNRAQAAVPLPSWRRYLVSTALLAASVSTALNMVWNASWLRHGGSPHGMGAGPGLWQHLAPLLLWSFAAATILSFFGKGKTRVLMFGWSLSMLVVFQLIFMLQFD
jgi:hypothetical protein